MTPRRASYFVIDGGPAGSALRPPARVADSGDKRDLLMDVG
ncbi:hypothetical protein [Austwickia chelonae]|nr:hypothetical protein [Austwickia chelonae]